jgi:hypothetical protein
MSFIAMQDLIRHPEHQTFLKTNERDILIFKDTEALKSKGFRMGPLTF